MDRLLKAAWLLALAACASGPPARRVEWRHHRLAQAAQALPGAYAPELVTVYTPEEDWEPADAWSFEAALGELAGRLGVGVARARWLASADAVVLRGSSGRGCARGPVWSLPADRRVVFLDPECLPDPWETRAGFGDAAALALGRKP